MTSRAAPQTSQLEQHGALRSERVQDCHVMHWYTLCKQSVADGRVFGLTEGLLEVQLSTDKRALPTAALHKEHLLGGITTKQGSRPETCQQNFSGRGRKSVLNLSHTTVKRPLCTFEFLDCIVQQITRDQELAGSKLSKFRTCTTRAASPTANSSSSSS